MIYRTLYNELITDNAYRKTLNINELIAMLERAIELQNLYDAARKKMGELDWNRQKLKPKRMTKYPEAPVFPQKPEQYQTEGIFAKLFAKSYKKKYAEEIALWEGKCHEIQSRYKKEVKKWEETEEWNRTLEDRRMEATKEYLFAVTEASNTEKDMFAFYKQYGLTFVDDEYFLCGIPKEVLQMMLKYLKNGSAYSCEDALYLCNTNKHNHIQYSGIHIECINWAGHDRVIQVQIAEDKIYEAQRLAEKEQAKRDTAYQEAQKKQQDTLERIQRDVDHLDLLATIEYIENTKK